MIADSPMVVYTHGKPPKPTARAINEKRIEWEKRGNKGKKISLSELLNSQNDEVR